jgi:hypothetical protein
MFRISIAVALAAAVLAGCSLAGGGISPGVETIVDVLRGPATAVVEGQFEDSFAKAEARIDAGEVNSLEKALAEQRRAISAKRKLDLGRKGNDTADFLLKASPSTRRQIVEARRKADDAYEALMERLQSLIDRYEAKIVPDDPDAGGGAALHKAGLAKASTGVTVDDLLGICRSALGGAAAEAKAKFDALPAEARTAAALVCIGYKAGQDDAAGGLKAGAGVAI